MAMAKKPDTSFEFGFNVNRGKKPKQTTGRRQPAATRQMYAIAKKTGQLAVYGGS
jgi:hypothetical protein